ncbi:type II toxin-antitoxin system YafO family toxin [Variovorax sp. RB3P1]|uniref:type II toxin-antitoxin system YafO family toxin n=1 Tax=Variovorax sp. RB3P1 TaxID=3443732 RepID=UPI003F4885D2
MATQNTQALSRQLVTVGEDPHNFAGEFDRWKALGSAGEYASYLFGKDGAYVAPPVNGVPNVLRHVHLVPLADPPALRRWNLQWRHRSRKVSDRALVYASDPTHGHLLIYILKEPDAHMVPRMATDDHRVLMLKLARIAEAFVLRGAVIG